MRAIQTVTFRLHIRLCSRFWNSQPFYLGTEYPNSNVSSKTNLKTSFPNYLKSLTFFEISSPAINGHSGVSFKNIIPFEPQSLMQKWKWKTKIDNYLDQRESLKNGHTEKNYKIFWNFLFCEFCKIGMLSKNWGRPSIKFHKIWQFDIMLVSSNLIFHL